MRRRYTVGTFLFGIAVLGTLMFFAAGPETRAANPVQIRLGTLAPSGSSFHTALVEMGQKWRDMSGGNVKLTIYPDGTQGGEADMVRMMRAGILTAGMFTVVGLSEIDPSVGGLSFLPLTFRSWEEYDYVVEKLSPRLEKLLLDKGFVVLFWGDAGWVRFFSKTPAVRPDDFKQLKMFTWAGDTQPGGFDESAGIPPGASRNGRYSARTAHRSDQRHSAAAQPGDAGSMLYRCQKHACPEVDRTLRCRHHPERHMGQNSSGSAEATPRRSSRSRNQDPGQRPERG